MSPRFIFAQRREKKRAANLFQQAARFSIDPKKNGSELPAYEGDPLWPALARHISRQASDEDRALLTDLAKNPEKRDGKLRWGLQYIVRGDVMLEDGTNITLDELCDELNLPHLPYLEEMPDELEVDWDKED